MTIATKPTQPSFAASVLKALLFIFGGIIVLGVIIAIAVPSDTNSATDWDKAKQIEADLKAKADAQFKAMTTEQHLAAAAASAANKADNAAAGMRHLDALPIAARNLKEFTRVRALLEEKRMDEATAAIQRLSPDERRDAILRTVNLKTRWWTTGFGNVMEADFTVTNAMPFAFKDFTITCEHAGPSGTKIDSNTRTIYEIVPAKGTKRLKEVNMGFIHSQAARSGCRITDLSLM